MTTEERLARLEGQVELLQSQLATKTDIADLRSEVDGVNTHLDRLSSDIGNSFARVLVTLGEIQDAATPAVVEVSDMNRLELRTWRRVRYLTQQQLGDLLGVDKMTVWRWEAGQSDCPAFLELALGHLDSLHTWSPDGVDAPVRLERLA